MLRTAARSRRRLGNPLEITARSEGRSPRSVRTRRRLRHLGLTEVMHMATRVSEDENPGKNPHSPRLEIQVRRTPWSQRDLLCNRGRFLTCSKGVWTPGIIEGDSQQVQRP